MKIMNNLFKQWNYPKNVCTSFDISRKLIKRSLSLSYNVIESSTLSENTPILMAHGLMGNKNNFNRVSKKLNEITNSMVITYDARNHGGSRHYDTMTLKEMSEDAIELLVTLKIPKCVLIGHSMGGRMAMYTALANPSYIDKLIIIDSSPSMPSAAGDSTLLYVNSMEKVVWNEVNSLSMARQTANLQLPEAIQDPMIRNFLLTNVREFHAGKYGWRVNLPAIRKYIEESRQLILEPNMSSYTGPTLFIAGGNSNFLVPEDYPFVRKLFPNCSITHIPDCGHWVHSEKPKEFISSVVGFLEEQKQPLF